MRTATRSPQPSGLGSTNVRKFTLADIASKSDNLPNRYCLYAREGWGKTSFGAKMRKPIFLQMKGETGLETLIQNGRLPETPHFPELQNWEDLLAALDFLLEGTHDYKTLVVDTLNSAERLCYEFVCDRDFEGDWGDKGFGGYQRGKEVSAAEWKMFLNKLDRLRREKGMMPFLLIHSRVRNFKNPEGPDYDRWTPDMDDKVWSLTHKWADAVLFGNFEVSVKQASKRDDITKKGKVEAESSRMLYTEQRPSFEAKNRMGLPREVYMGESADEAYSNFAKALKEGREAKPAVEVSVG